MSECDDSLSPENLLREGKVLRRLARQLLDDAAERDDVVQDAYVAALERRGAAVGSGRWLNVVTRRLAQLRLRRGARRRAREEQVARRDVVPSAAETAAAAEVTRRVATAVEQLEEPYRTAIVMRFWHDLPPRTIAKRIGVPTNTVRSRIQRGLVRLRHQLDGESGNRAAWQVPLAAVAWPIASAATWTTGAMVMGTSGKIFAAVVSAAFAWWLWSESAPLTSPPAKVTTVAVRAAAESMTPNAADVAARDRAVANATDVGAPPLLVVTGVLIDEATMAPIADGSVRLVDASRRDAREPDLEAHAVSGDNGTFRLEEHRREAAAHPELLIEVSGWATLRHIVPGDQIVVDGGIRSVDIGQVLVAPGTGVRGTVVESDGQVVADANVYASTDGLFFGGIQRHPTWVLNSLIPLATTNASGWFASNHRIVPHANETMLLAVADRGIGWLSVPATRHRTELERRIALLPSCQLRATIVDSAGAPVVGATLSALPLFAPLGTATARTAAFLGRRSDVRALFVTTSDEQGIAALPFLPIGGGGDWGTAGGYRLVVAANGYVEYAKELTLTAGPRQHDAELVRQRNLTIDVVVVDGDGEAVAGAAVALADLRASTDAEGAGSFADMPIRTAELHYSVTADGYRTAHGSWQVSDETPAVLRVELQQAASLAGEVVDQHGQPVAGARVFVDGPMKAETGPDGLFAIAGLSTGPLEVVVFPPVPESEWAQTKRETPLPASQQPHRWVLERLAPGIATVKITLVDMATREQASARAPFVYTIDENGMRAGPSFEPTANRIGSVVFEQLHAGRYQAYIEDRVKRIFEIAPGQTVVELAVEIGAPGTIEGEIVCTGTPPEKVTVTCGPTSAAGRWVEFGSSILLTRQPGPHVWGLALEPSRDSRFRMENVDPHQVVTIQATGGGLYGRAAVRVPAGGVAYPQVVMAPSARIKLQFDPPCPLQSYGLSLRRDGASDWDEPRRRRFMKDRTIVRETVQAGHHSWRIVSADPLTEVRILAEGDFDVRPGSTAVVPVKLQQR